MDYSHLLPLSYLVPTFAPSPPGNVMPQGDAPAVAIADVDLQARAQRLVNVLYWAADHFSELPGMQDPSTLKTFIAPEFYFRKASPDEVHRGGFAAATSFGSYPEHARHELAEAVYNAIHASQRFADWVIVGGTICSALPPGEDDRLRLLNTAMMFRGQRPAMSTGVPYILMEKHYISPIDGPPRYLHANLDPTTVYSFNLNPDQDLDNLIYWDQMSVGLEVCLDHWKQVLTNALIRLEAALGPRQDRLDLQLVTSCGMSVVDQATAVKDGALIHLVDGMTSRPDYTEPIFQVGRYDASAARVDMFPADAFHFESVPAGESFNVNYAGGAYAAAGCRQGVAAARAGVALIASDDRTSSHQLKL